MFDNFGHSQPQTPTEPPPPQKVVRFDRGYIRTVPGILKAVELLCNIIGFICMKVSLGQWVTSIFYNIVYWLAIIITGFILLAYMMHLVEKFHTWPWLKFEFFYCAVVSLTYIILSIIATTIGESVGYAVGFFGLVAILAYGYDGFLKYKAWKRGLPPQ